MTCVIRAQHEEVAGFSTVASSGTTTTDSKVDHVEHHNLDVVLSVDRSPEGVWFRCACW